MLKTFWNWLRGNFVTAKESSPVVKFDPFIDFSILMEDLAGEEFDETSRFSLCQMLRDLSDAVVDSVYDDEGVPVGVTAAAVELANVAMAIACQFGDLLDLPEGE